MEETDQELLIRYHHGDVDALEELVDKYRRPLFSFIINMLNNPGDADEIFQEVWFRAIKKLGTYKQKNFFGWLVRIARNLIIDRARRRKPDFSLDQEHEEGLPLRQTMPGKDPGPERKLENLNLHTKVANAVGNLPGEQKEVFLMRVQANLSFKEIASIQKVSINTALARMQYALTKLRPLLREYKDM